MRLATLIAQGGETVHATFEARDVDEVANEASRRPPAMYPGSRVQSALAVSAATSLVAAVANSVNPVAPM